MRCGLAPGEPAGGAAWASVAAKRPAPPTTAMVSSCRREAADVGFVSVWVTIGDPSPATARARVGGARPPRPWGRSTAADEPAPDPLDALEHLFARRSGELGATARPAQVQVDGRV